jgi:hypothetical protein
MLDMSYLRSSCWPVRFLVAALVALAYPQLSVAKCHAADFKISEIQTVLRGVQSSKENLAADMENASRNPNAKTVDLIGIMGAARDVQGQSMVVAFFTSLLLIHSDMATPTDKATVDNYIGTQSTLIYQDLKDTADMLSRSRPDEAHPYGEYEVKQARDVIRSLQALFSCARDN